MAFILLNILTSFQTYINKFPTKKFEIFVIICLANIFIYTKDQGPGYIKIVK